jgi:hypothetical protein
MTRKQAKRERELREWFTNNPMVFYNETTGEEVQIPISAELYDKARLLGWTGAQMVAEAVRLARPGAVDIEVMGATPPLAN